ncbi:putative ribonuclease H-like domain-containing protein [Tanacetum coccineum]
MGKRQNWPSGGYDGGCRDVFINILLGFPGPSDGLRLHSIVFFSSGSGLTADSSVLTLTLAFLDFGLDFAQSFPFHAQFCHFGLGNLEILLQDHAVVDSGCSSHMTGNKAYISDYEDFNRGFMAFGSDPKGGKITGKDSDYGGASLDRKSTTGGCQFLGRRLISWQCKKQTIAANSTTEAEYVAS